MNLSDKIDELNQLNANRDILVNKKKKLIKDRHSKWNIFLNLLLTSAVFTVLMQLFSDLFIVAFLSSIAYVIVVPGFAYHRNKVRIKILDVDINILDNNIEEVKKQIIKLEREKLLSMVEEENKEKNNQVIEYRDMPLFDRDNLENNIKELDLGMKLTLSR